MTHRGLIFNTYLTIFLLSVLLKIRHLWQLKTVPNARSSIAKYNITFKEGKVLYVKYKTWTVTHNVLIELYKLDTYAGK